MLRLLLQAVILLAGTIGCYLSSATQAWGTALTITNVSTLPHNSGSGTADIEFDISWQDSWRVSTGPANWDAAWVFIKFQRNGGNWQHATRYSK